ncbi:hypothetical protein SUBVAR_04780 [Subdoligranulum variabile DSM 15176]|uniref:Uncharacterized protein n=1 Tax=Subdoligranulum variabile DSM 15176 TaxID=411471 RepID=D1PK59_9FIRM|nr:hypothetical protein SUBVAR_04780 [Subdoligranulum variabile DSM 15176]
MVGVSYHTLYDSVNIKVALLVRSTISKAKSVHFDERTLSFVGL